MHPVIAIAACALEADLRWRPPSHQHRSSRCQLLQMHTHVAEVAFPRVGAVRSTPIARRSWWLSCGDSFGRGGVAVREFAQARLTDRFRSEEGNDRDPRGHALDLGDLLDLGGCPLLQER